MVDRQRWRYYTGPGSRECLFHLQQAEAPRLAILDWLMPGLDGVEVCRQVRQWDHAPYVYVILLTSKDQQEDIITGLEAGADDYLIKPFDPGNSKPVSVPVNAFLTCKRRS
jgi:DNA-binding response OmpR family regulator